MRGAAFIVAMPARRPRFGSPAEHNVGHLPRAKLERAGFHRQLDPTNSLNADIGQASGSMPWC
ncbi:hypothetical protein DVR11_25980 [Paracoccus versutus]|nr:hypothetical protein DVR11_25980 [Paracoccus versutus]